jgi:hypothetical protein
MTRTIIIILISLFLIAPVYSQDTTKTTTSTMNAGIAEVTSANKLETKIKADEFVQVNKKVIFDASNSTILATGTPQYNWDFGDYNQTTGKDVVHQYKKIGKYNVNLTITQNGQTSSVSQQIFVYDKKALLIVDKKTEDEISLLKLQAAENGIALQLLSTIKEDGSFSTEDNLVKEIAKINNYIIDSDILIFYTKSSAGLQAFARFWQNVNSNDQEIIRKKFFVTITDGSMDVSANFVFQSFKVIKPNYILLTRQEALSSVLNNKDYAKTADILKNRGIEYRIIDERGKKSAIFLLSNLITTFVAKDVSTNSIYLILIIPYLACMIVFFRQIVGLSTFGVYTPVITAASFYILGIWFGIITFLFAVIVGYIIKYILNKFELLYLSKVALNLGIISLSFLAIIWLILFLGMPINLSVAIFPMLVMSSVAEKFMAAQSEEGFRGAIFGVLETLVVVVVSYFLISWTLFNNVIMSWPELILIPLVLILFIGKFSGLRLSEYLRFKSLFKEHAEE